MNYYQILCFQNTEQNIHLMTFSKNCFSHKFFVFNFVASRVYPTNTKSTNERQC